MPLPLWSGTAIAGGLSLLGGIMGDNKADKRHRQNLKMSQAQFDAQMDQTIQRRVADATQAGVHPLFALGGSLGASPTITAGGGGQPTGSATGDALQHVASIIANMPGQRANAARDEAEAAYLDAQTAKINQSLAASGRDGLGTGSARTFPLPDSEPMGEAVYYAPEIPKSKSPGVRAGTNPGEIDVIMPDGRSVRLYDPDLGLDEIGQAKFVYQRAIHHGTDAIEAVANYLQKITGRRPISRFHEIKVKPKHRKTRFYTDRATYLRNKYGG